MNKFIQFFSLFFILVSSTGCDFSSEDVVVAQGPVMAQYTFVKETKPGLVTFINTSEYADNFLWDFGDGTTSTIKNPAKTFTKTGDYVVKLTAKNSVTGELKEYTSTVSLFIFDGGLVLNGNFETGTSPWTLGVANPIASSLLIKEDGNTYFSINVTAAGNQFDVNLSQKAISMVQGKTYRLTFDAWSSVNRSIIVGIGLSGAPWTNQTVSRNLTPTKQNFSIDLVANFASADSRVIFDMGAAVGRVNIDNVTVKLLP
jgi:PKD repeat protein